MKLQHCLGGLEGLGPVAFDKRVFAEQWEKRMFGINLALLGLSRELKKSGGPRSATIVLMPRTDPGLQRRATSDFLMHSYAYATIPTTFIVGRSCTYQTKTKELQHRRERRTDL